MLNFSSYLLDEVRGYLRVSDYLDSVGLYVWSSKLGDEGLRLGSLLRLGEDEGVKEDEDSFSVSDVSGEVGDINDYVYKDNERHNLDKDIVHVGYLSGYSDGDAERVALDFLAKGGVDVLSCLKGLSDGLPVVREYMYSDDVDELVRKSLFNYFRNPLFLELSGLEINNIVRDVVGGVVDGDTVKDFKVLMDRYSGRRDSFKDKREFVISYIGEHYPELSGDYRLLHSLLAPGVNNLEPYLRDVEFIRGVVGGGNLFRSIVGYVLREKVKGDLLRSILSYNVDILGMIDWDNFYDSNLLFCLEVYKLVDKDYWNLVDFENEYSLNVLRDIKNFEVGLFPYYLSDFDNWYFWKIIYFLGGIDVVKNFGPISREKFDFFLGSYNREDVVFAKRRWSVDGLLVPSLYSIYKSNGWKKIDDINALYPYLGEGVKDIDTNSFVIDNPEKVAGAIKNGMGYPKVVTDLYLLMPFMNGISFGSWYSFAREKFKELPEEEDLDEELLKYSELINLKFYLFISGVALSLFGGSVSGVVLDNIKSIVESLGMERARKLSGIVNNHGDALKKILGGNLNIGSIGKVVSNPELLDGGYNVSELTFISNWMNVNAGLDKVLSVRKSILGNKNYKGVVWDSDEYNKLFLMIACEPDIVGKDKGLLVNLFDSATLESSDSSLFYYLNAAFGIRDFSGLNDNEDVLKVLRRVQWESFKIVRAKFDGYDRMLSNLNIKKAQLIKLGGFSVLWNSNPDELLNIFGIRDADVEDFKNWLKVYSSRAENFSDFYLKAYEPLAVHKFIIYALKEISNKVSGFSKIIQGEKSDIVPEKMGYKINLSELGDVVYNILNNELGRGSLEGSYAEKVSYSRYITFPKRVIDQSSLENLEDVENASKIIKFFKDPKKILNLYSFKTLQAKGYPSGFDNIPDFSIKSGIVHDLANLLPDNLSGDYSGLDLYYEKYLNNYSKDLKFVAESWNNSLNILDKDMQFVNSGLVRDFAEDLNPFELSEKIKISNMRELFESLKPEVPKFALEFIQNVKKPNSLKGDNSKYKTLYYGAEDVYKMGLGVPMPLWSDFSANEGEMTLRFLPREDPKGMFLGTITGCCQHPESWAASCAYDGHLNPLAAFAVFEINGKIIFQSYVWSDKNGNVCFDSIEGFRDNKNNLSYANLAKDLLLKFGKSLGDKKLTIGSNFLGFIDRTEALVNPTQTHREGKIRELLVGYSPNGDSFYKSDSDRQFKVV